MDKTRIDAWDSALTEEEAWAAYCKCRPMSWSSAVAYIADEYRIDPPSKSAYYRWLSRMRAEDAAIRLRRAAAAVAEVGKMAETVGTDDSQLISAYKTLAADAIMSSDDPEAASRYVQMAMAIADRARGRKELELKERAQRTKDESLKLAREKFEAAQAKIDATKETMTNKKLTPKERDARIREIFGL